MSAPVRWGILGPGSIARKFAEGLQSAPDGQLVAVGFLCLLNGNIVGNHVQFLPEPTGLILSLFGMLMLTLGAYAWAVFEGPFAIPVEPFESE